MQWVSHLDGVLARLAEPDAWSGTDEQIAFAVGQIEQLLSKLATVEDCAAGGGSEGMDWLGTVNLGVDTTSIEIADIPGDYRHLLLLLSARTDYTASTVDNLLMRFNDDVTPVSYWTGSQTTIGSQSTLGGFQAGGNYAGVMLYRVPATAYSALSAYLYGTAQVWIYDYARIGQRRQSNWQGHSWKELPTGNQRSYTYWGGAVWNNITDAINKLTILPYAGANLVAGSSVAIYGIK